MSSFADYESASRHYDKTRIPIGTEIILGCLTRQAEALGILAVLDAGCGTGAYSAAIVDRVGRVAALDLSVGMLAQAEAKLRAPIREGRCSLHQGPITALPFDDGSFEAVLVNQVVQHLGDETRDGFPALERVFEEVARVLKPGGSFLFNHCSQTQLSRSYWYYALLPEASALTKARFAPIETVLEMLGAAGFDVMGRFAPLDATAQGVAYFDPRGPLDPAWRAGDSIWAAASEMELDRALTKLRRLDEDGGLDSYMRDHDAWRPELGQITILHARRR